MKVVKKKQANGHIKLDATASSAEVSNALNQASEQFCAQMNIRPEGSKTPAQVASERLGIKDLDSVVGQQAAEMLVPHALNKHNIVPAFSPQPQATMPLKRGRAFQFTLDVVPKPLYELEDYSPIEFSIQAFEPDEEEVDRQIGQMAQQFITFAATDPHPVQKGDSVLLKMSTTKDGEQVVGLTTDSRSFTTGMDLMPVGFEEGLMGMEVGETKTFKFEGPGLDEDFNEIMEEYETTVTILELQKEVVPVINDEWVAKNMPMYKSYADLRADIDKRVNDQRRKYYEDYKRNMAAAELAKRFKGSIPDEIYEGSMAEEQRQLRMQVSQTGKTWEKFCEEQGGEQQVNMMLMVSMRQKLVQGYCLDAYYRHMGLSYTDADLDESCFQLSPQNPHAVRVRMEQNGLGFALREAAERLCACKHLVENATITEAAPESATGPRIVM